MRESSSDQFNSVRAAMPVLGIDRDRATLLMKLCAPAIKFNLVDPRVPLRWNGAEFGLRRADEVHDAKPSVAGRGQQHGAVPSGRGDTTPSGLCRSAICGKSSTRVSLAAWKLRCAPSSHFGRSCLVLWSRAACSLAHSNHDLFAAHLRDQPGEIRASICIAGHYGPRKKGRLDLHQEAP